jgi:hypothetical protein
MDREAAVIRAEMSHTRAELDRKITQLEARAQAFTPQQLKERYVPEFFVDRVIGGILTLIGVRLAWGMYRQKRRNRRTDVRTAAAAYGRW